MLVKKSEGVGTTGIGDPTEQDQSAKSLEVVVVPIVRPMNVAPLGIDHPTTCGGAKQPMLQEQLACSLSSCQCLDVARGAVVLDQAPDWSEALVKR